MARCNASCGLGTKASGSWAIDEGHDLDKVLTLRDLVDSDNTFFAATGVTDGALLQGVEFFGDRVETHSVVMRSFSGTVRFVDAQYRVDRLGDLDVPGVALEAV